MKTAPEIRNDVTAIRLQREILIAERQAVESVPVDADELRRRIDALIADAAKRADIFNRLGSADLSFHPSSFDRDFRNAPFAAFAVLMPERLRETMLASVPAGGLTAKERAARLEALDVELFRLELNEELALREIDGQTGGLEYRHRDANADILLAPDEELKTELAVASNPPPRIPRRAA